MVMHYMRVHIFLLVMMVIVCFFNIDRIEKADISKGGYAVHNEPCILRQRQQEEIISGELTSIYNRRIIDFSSGMPLVRIYRIYTSMGSHTVSVTPLGNDAGDDPGLIVFDADGNEILNTWGYNGVTESINVPSDGIIYILVYSTDDDTVDYDMMFNLSIDGLVYMQGVVYSLNDNNNPTIPSGSIAVHDLQVSQGTIYNISLEWDRPSDDLDLYVFSPNSTYVYNSSTSSMPEHIEFVGEINNHYTILVHKYGGSAASTTYTLHIMRMGLVTLEIEAPKNGTIMRGENSVWGYAYMGGEIESYGLYMIIDGTTEENITDYYDIATGRYNYTFNTSDYDDGMHSIEIRLNCSISGNYYTLSSKVYVLFDNTPSSILLVDDDGGDSYETYYISALNDCGLKIHEDFEAVSYTHLTLPTTERV